MNQYKLSELVSEIDIQDFIVEEASLPTLTHIKASTLEKAGFQTAFQPEAALNKADNAVSHGKLYPFARKLKWPFRVLIAAAMLCLCMVSAFAVTDLGYVLEARFGDDYHFLTKLRLVSDYGNIVNVSDTQQGITIKLEEAYANESGRLLLLSMQDAEGRLNETSDIMGSFENNFAPSYSTQKTMKMDEAQGILYGLYDIQFYDKVTKRNCRYVIPELYTHTKYHENIKTGISIIEHVRQHSGAYAVAEDGSIRVNEGDNALNIAVPQLPGLTITDIWLSEEGLMIKSAYRNTNPDTGHHSMSFSLVSPMGEIISSNMMSSWSTSEREGENVFYGRHGFVGFESIEALRGYTLCLSYMERTGRIQGEWVLEFKMPPEDASEKKAINEIITAQDLIVRIRNIIITKNSIIVEAQRLSEQKPFPKQQTDFSWFYDKHDTISARLYSQDTMESGGSLGSLLDAYYKEDNTRMVLMYEGNLKNTELQFINELNGQVLLRIPLDELN